MTSGERCDHRIKAVETKVRSCDLEVMSIMSKSKIINVEATAVHWLTLWMWLNVTASQHWQLCFGSLLINQRSRDAGNRIYWVTVEHIVKNKQKKPPHSRPLSSLITVMGFSGRWPSSELSRAAALGSGSSSIRHDERRAAVRGERGNAVRAVWNQAEHLIPDLDSICGIRCTRVQVQGLSCLVYLSKRRGNICSAGCNVNWCHGYLEPRGSETQERLVNWLCISHFKLTCCCAGSQWHGTGAALANVRWNLRGASDSRGSHRQQWRRAQRAWWFLGQSESSPLTPPHEQPESCSLILRSAKKQDYCPCVQMNIAGSKWRIERGVMSLSEFAPSIHVDIRGQENKALLPEVRGAAVCFPSSSDPTGEPEGIMAVQRSERH